VTVARPDCRPCGNPTGPRHVYAYPALFICVSRARTGSRTKREREKRLVARASPEIHQLIAEAAELQGSTVSQFLLDSALERAAQVTERATRLSVSREAFEKMMVALDRPARPLPRLRQAARRYRETVDAPDQEAAAQQET